MKFLRVLIRPLFILAGGIACASSTAACGSSHDDQLTPDFQGVYTSTSEGALHVMAFAPDHHYLLMPTGCEAQSCTELGTWSYDAAAQALALTDASSMTTRTLHVDVLATTEDGTASGGLVTKDDLTDPSQVLSGSGSQLNNGQSALADSTSQLLQAIAKALIDKQGMQQQQGGGDQAGGGQAGGGQAGGGQAADPGGNNNAQPPAVKAACKIGIPTPQTPAAELAAYWAACPQGPMTTP